MISGRRRPRCARWASRLRRESGAASPRRTDYRDSRVVVKSTLPLGGALYSLRGEAAPTERSEAYGECRLRPRSEAGASLRAEGAPDALRRSAAYAAKRRLPSAKREAYGPRCCRAALRQLSMVPV